MAKFYFPILVVSCSLLISCGGSSSQPNLAPTFNHQTAIEVIEGQLDVISIKASDPEGDALTYSIVAADDSGLFSLDSNTDLRFVQAPDYEAPMDLGGDNNYQLTVAVSDGVNQATSTLSIRVINGLRGRVVDGPLSASTVFFDLNGDLIANSNETRAITDDQGYFLIPDQTDSCVEEEGCRGNFVALGGVDISTNTPLQNFVLIGTADNNENFFLSPLSTVIQQTSIPQEMLQALDLSLIPENIAPLDPWESAQDGDGELLVINQQLGLLLQTLNSLLLHDSSLTAVQVIAGFATSLADTAQAEQLDLSDKLLLASVLNSTVSELSSENPWDTDSLVAVAKRLAMVNTVLDLSESELTQDFSVAVMKAAQSEMQSAVMRLATNELNLEEFILATVPEILFDDVPSTPEQINTDGDGLVDILDLDDDNDGVTDEQDVFPLDESEWIDTDGDQLGNNADPDDDNDNVADADDAFPYDQTEWVDTDGDQLGNNADPDDDNDNFLDAEDAFPLDSAEWIDTDGDQLGNNADPDDDNDNFPDAEDAFPLDGTEWIDTDGDQLGNNADPDDDNDGFVDNNDAFPVDNSEWLDTDGDQLGNNADPDDDNDSFLDAEDAFPLDSTEWVDTDGDQLGNNADLDDDNDGVNDDRDDYPLDATLTPPTAIFSASRLQGSVPLVVTFDASETIAGHLDDTLVSYSWDFGDGSSGSGVSPAHTYDTPGTFVVTMTALNTDNLTDKFISQVFVSDGLFSISGTISVADAVAVDSDVNDLGSEVIANNTFATAQIVGNPSTLIGYVNTPNNGPRGQSYSNGDAQDYYQLEALGGEVINLVMDSPGNVSDGYTDLDIYLYDSNFNLVAYSISVTRYERLEIPIKFGTYYLSVEVWSEGASKYYLSIDSDNMSNSSGWSSDSEFAVGELIVKQRPNKTRSTSVTKILGASPQSVKSMGTRGPKLYRFGKQIGRQSISRAKGFRYASPQAPTQIELEVATLLAAKQLLLDPSVEYAEPNFLRRAKQIPTDQQYGAQWHYEKIKLPQAWDITTGDSDIKVAVLDTGIFEAHPDLEARLSNDGFDFINSSYNAADGDEINEDTNGNGQLDPGEDLDGDNYLDDGQEIDNDADDPGDGYENPLCSDSSYSSSFHGTHVAGTVGAETNNDDDSEDLNNNGLLDDGEDIDSDGVLDSAGDGIANGVAGVNWIGEIMNLRVLGCEGGYDFDIANAIRYAAGLDNQSGIIVDDPADIANMSLGGGGTSNTMSDAIDDAYEAGMIIVAAAGNSSTELPSYPAAYQNVISVSATTSDDELASYSNYGATIDVAAPGSGVLSTLAEFSGEDNSIVASYASYNGTSMAAPHVAGVIGLMKAVYPALSPSDLDAILISGRVTTDLGDTGRDELFGIGRIDAYKAVKFSKDLADGIETIPVTPILSVNPTYLNFGKSTTQRTVAASNIGNGDLLITNVSSEEAYISVLGPEEVDGNSEYTIIIDRSNLADGIYPGVVSFESNGGNVDVSLRFQVGESQGEPGFLGNISVILKDLNTELESSAQIQSSSNGVYSYTISGIEAGTYQIRSGTDLDNDGLVCSPAEACGAYPTLGSPEQIIVNEDKQNLDFALQLEIPTD